jgi:hypothetical protein
LVQFHLRPPFLFVGSRHANPAHQVGVLGVCLAYQ